MDDLDIIRYNNYKHDLYHWFEIEPDFFPLGNKYIKRVNKQNDVFKSIYLSTQARKVKKLLLKDEVELGCIFDTSLGLMFKEFNEAKLNDGFIMLFNLFNKTKDKEVGFILYMILLSTSNIPLKGKVKEIEQHLISSLKDINYAPFNFIYAVANLKLYNNKEEFLNYIKLAMDENFSPAKAYYALNVSIPNKKYQEAFMLTAKGVAIHEKLSLTTQGILYLNGYSVISSNEQAYKCFQKAANLNQPLACYYTAYMLANGTSYSDRSEYEDAYSVAMLGSSMHDSSCNLLIAKLNFDESIINFSHENGQIHLGLALIQNNKEAYYYCERHNIDPNEMINIYHQYMD